MASFTERIVGAASLNPRTYEEVEADKTSIGQAMTVVVLASIAAGLGTGEGILAAIAGALMALVAWFIWAFVTYVIGTKMLPEPQTEADIGQLLRTTGFAASPGLLRILTIIPGLGWLIGFVVSLWMLAAMVVAVRQALDYKSTMRAVGVCLVGWLLLVLVTAVLMGTVGRMF
ncbi:MAG: YIP1 family protein [Gemmatimonadota bacterium]|nr:MAG: YIP1 family protein [Gemmatimonadota bacterium]